MAGWAAVMALMEPERADMVATLGEVTGSLALERLYRQVWRGGGAAWPCTRWVCRGRGIGAGSARGGVLPLDPAE